ncbi:MAG: hypothetical protein PHI18_09185 [bacterium]|nr:hypothetical protein [bacterium]
MSFTTPDIIKTHLLNNAFGEFSVRRHPVQLSEYDDVALPHHPLVEDSDTVKWNTEIAPALEGPITLSSDNWSVLNAQHLVEDSVVVALTAGLETVYREEVDYQVDAENGRLRRAAGSGIPDGQSVYVYYFAYTLFARDSDYEINGALGTIRRAQGSAIPDGANVLVDYSVAAGSLSDVLISQAITEAEDRIIRALAGGYDENSTDQGLKTGATELALAILARDQAAEVLARLDSSDSASRARQWESLAESFEQRAWKILASFLDPYALRSPEVRSHD